MVSLWKRPPCKGSSLWKWLFAKGFLHGKGFADTIMSFAWFHGVECFDAKKPQPGWGELKCAKTIVFCDGFAAFGVDL